MNEVQVFNNPDLGEIRTIQIDGEPWFVGKDVAEILEYRNTKKALSDHVDDEDKYQGDGVTIRDPMGRKQHPTIINESGMYALIFGSKLPNAKKFKRWVTSEVLPAIRKTGCYAINCKERKPEITSISLKFKEYSADYEQRKSWFTYMLTALAVKTMTSSKNLLHQAYQMMILQGINLDVESLSYFEATGVTASTFEVIVSDPMLSEKLADILVYNMKSKFIGIE